MSATASGHAAVNVARRILRLLRRVMTFFPRQVLGTITHVATREPIVALTFDDGPHPEYTPRLLEILARYGAKATFFVVGETATKYPELLQKMAGAGHAIGNHSWGHRSFPALGRNERRQEMEACEALIAPYSQKLFRPPYGNQIFASRFDAWRLGFRVIAWNVTGTDWRNDDAQAVFRRLADRLRPGSIILLHDALFDLEDQKFAVRDATLGAVQLLLERYAQTYRFVTVPELLQRGRVVKAWWHQPGDDAYLAKLTRPHAGK